MQSLLINATVMHLRLRPVRHRFVYPVFMLRINLNEAYSAKVPFTSFLLGLNKWRPLAIHFKDYGPRDGSNLMSWIQQILQSASIQDIEEVELQSFPRVFGYAFNPICLWYCYDKHRGLKAILAEVNNTFGEHHFYLLHTKNHQVINADSVLISKKMMHVSPFCEVKGHYEFTFKESSNKLVVKIDYHDEVHSTEPNSTLIHTAIAGHKLALTTTNLLSALIKQPFLTFGVFFRIHWQALILWRKKVPFFRQAPAAPSQLTICIPSEQEQIK
jgi:DUF1365 family protein